MRPLITALLITFSIIFFMGPHGAGIPMILVSAISAFAFLSSSEPENMAISFYSFLVVAAYITLLIMRFKGEQVHDFKKVLLSILVLNLGLVGYLMIMDESVRNVPLYTAIPFFIVSAIGIFMLTRKIWLQKSEEKVF